VAERKSFLLRVDPALLDAMQRWANDDLRSLNGQMEFVLRQALQAAGRRAGKDEVASVETEASGGTDSGDRPSHAAGAYADGRTGAEPD
jgi:hypothetical protein